MGQQDKGLLIPICSTDQTYMGLDMRKPVFGFSNNKGAGVQSN